MNVAGILNSYKSLDASSAADCDRFFESWGVGQTLLESNMPSERLDAYRNLLEICKNYDAVKYEKMHKGTAFFFCGLSLFDMKYYESAIFYFTAALSEDQRRSGKPLLDEAIETPAGKMLSLDPSGKWLRFHAVILVRVESLLNDFNAENSTTYSVQDLVTKFVHPTMQQGHYAIVTSFYSLLLEHPEKYKNLRLAGPAVDSMEPILLSLFKGALIFETLLKQYYPRNNRGQRIMTLGGFSANAAFAGDFPGVNLSIATTNLQDILDDATDVSVKTVMETTARIRNTTGHKLLWDNVFVQPENYPVLVNQELFAILHVITKQW